MSGRPAALAVAADLRLVPPALAAWAAALVVVAWPQAVADALLLPVALVLVAAAAVLVAAVLSVHRPARSAAGRRGRRRRSAPAVVLGVVTTAVVLVSGGVAQTARAPAPLVAAATHGRTVELVGRVSSVEDAPFPGRGGARFTLRVTAWRADARWYQGAPVVVDVVAPRAARVGTRVHVTGIAADDAPGRRTAVRVTASRPPTVTAPPPSLEAWAARVRSAARGVTVGLPPDVRGLLPAVTVGDTDQVPADLVAAMRTTGLAHVMAVSGAHFALLGALVLAVGAALRLPVLPRVALAVAAGAGLLLVVGPSPSVVRAAVMGAVGLLGLLAGRRSTGQAALAAAVLVLLVVDPWLATDVGFALSVAATAGLVLLGGPLAERWSRWCGRHVAAALAAPVAAQVGCLPVTLAVWPTLGPWSVLANLAVAPAVAPATLLGLLAALLAGWWPAAAGAAAAAAGAACWWMAAVAREIATWPAAGVAWWPGAGGVACAAGVVVAVGVLARRADPPG